MVAELSSHEISLNVLKKSEVILDIINFKELLQAAVFG